MLYGQPRCVTLREILLGVVSGIDESYKKPAFTSVRRVSASDSRNGALQAVRTSGLDQRTHRGGASLPVYALPAVLLELLVCRC